MFPEQQQPLCDCQLAGKLFFSSRVLGLVCLSLGVELGMKLHLKNIKQSFTDIACLVSALHLKKTKARTLQWKTH